MYVLECQLTTSSSIDETFALFENPNNLAKITPSWLRFRILTEGLQMREGLEIEYRLRLFGIPLSWKTEITAYDPPKYFIDEAIQSPYQFWRHHHSFRETSEGTVVADRVEYDLPLGLIGRAAHGLVALQLRAIFAYRQRAILELLGEKATELQPPSIRRG